MADEADITAERMERELSLLVTQSKRKAGPPPNGQCHWCEAPVAEGLRFCDADCAHEHERYQAAQVRNRGTTGA